MDLHVCVPCKKEDVTTIIPIFLPFLGCSQRCIFCAQHQQTGVGVQDAAVELHKVRALLDTRLVQGRPPAETGFFGGTFTCMPPAILKECIALVQEYRSKGALLGARCSTRPDAVNPQVLDLLRAGGFGTVELGVQSFSSPALHKSLRGYSGDCARAACAAVREAGLKLGVQLLPGMPGVDAATFVDDVRAALDCGAQMLRFYPCLVIAGTKLAHMWREGHYKPWPLDETLNALAHGYGLAQSRGVPVIRMGLAPEKSLLPDILAGPQHPALGSMVQGLALVQAAERALQGRRARGATVPRRCQGFFWGQAQSLVPRWAALGLTPQNVLWADNFAPKAGGRASTDCVLRC